MSDFQYELFNVRHMIDCCQDNPNYMQVYGAFVAGPKQHLKGCFLILEYIEGMTLKEYLKEATNEDIIKIAKWMFETFRHLNDYYLTYDDLHMGNVMVTTEGDLKLIDYGSINVIIPPTHERQYTSYLFLKDDIIKLIHNEMIKGRTFAPRYDEFISYVQNSEDGGDEFLRQYEYPIYDLHEKSSPAYFGLKSQYDQRLQEIYDNYDKIIAMLSK